MAVAKVLAFVSFAVFVLTVYGSIDADEIESLERELTDLKLRQREADNAILEYELSEAKRAIDASCNDQLGKSRCQKYRKYGFCRKDYRLKKLCRKTCGFCGVMPKVPHCAKTALGCCWDFQTPKKDGAGTNCPKCRDNPKKRRVCKMFEPDCNSNKDAGSFMRKTCPRTCGVCGEGAMCMDDPAKEMYCEEWSNEGMCETEKPMMSVYCRKTCGIC
uniref:331-2 propeptide n=1 Tax=Malo kingi TaxID=500532 RepID=A0A0R8IEE4_9CNID|nr:331-2 propeptide [Malo kingi]